MELYTLYYKISDNFNLIFPIFPFYFFSFCAYFYIVLSAFNFLYCDLV